MLFAIDAGNTNIVFAVLDGEAVKAAWRAEARPRASVQALTREMEEGLKTAGIAPQTLTGGMLASVVPPLTGPLKAAFERLADQPLGVIGDPGIELGIEVRMDNPSEVGADRLANAVAGRHYFGAPVIIVDFGTATTFDVVSADGAYVGGVISPGIRLSIKTLHEQTAQLPLIELKKPRDGVIGRNTEDAINAGIFYGYLGLIEGVIARLRRELGRKAATIATGGYAPLFTPSTGTLDHARSDLTLQGLRLIYERNRVRA